MMDPFVGSLDSKSSLFLATPVVAHVEAKYMISTPHSQSGQTLKAIHVFCFSDVWVKRLQSKRW